MNVIQVADGKEKLGYVAADAQQEQVIEKNYELPDGQIVTVGAERFECYEPYWKHDIGGFVNEAIKKCDVDIRRICMPTSS